MPPVQFRDDDGTWKPIDGRPVRISDRQSTDHVVHVRIGAHYRRFRMFPLSLSNVCAALAVGCFLVALCLHEGWLFDHGDAITWSYVGLILTAAIHLPWRR